MNPARFAVQQTVLMHLLFVVGMAAGVFVLLDMNVDVFPNVSFAQAKINTVWRGASADDVEDLVTRRIEDEIEEIGGIDRIVSHSQKDWSLIDVKFREDLSDDEFDRYFNDLRAALERVQDLPEAAERPQIKKQTINEVYPLLQVIVTTDQENGEALERPMRSVAKELRRRLMSVDGVARVSDFPIRKRELLIDVDPDRARQHGLTLSDVHNAVTEAHINLPGGNIESDQGELNVRSAGQFRGAREMGTLQLRRAPGSPTIPLTDIASITEGHERRLYIGRHNGRFAINLGVLKSDNADSLDVRNAVMETVAAFQDEQLPKGIIVTTAIDATKVIKNRMRVLQNSLLFGIVLVFFVLWLFVGARNSLLAVMGVPFSFLLALVVLHPMGITINALTLFSMVLVSGMIVDDAIIVIENIYRHVERGEPFRDAIVQGVSEVALPVLAATLTTAAAFLPMLLMEGVMGVFMSIIPKTVVICLFASLIECFWILPAHYFSFGPRKASSRRFPIWFDKQRDRFARILKRVLMRPKTLLIGALMLVSSSFVLVRTIPVNLFPSDFQAFYVNLVLPASFSIEQTSEATREIEALLAPVRDAGEIEDFTTTVGVTYTPDNQVILRANVAQILIGITDDVANHGDPEALINSVRRIVEEYGASDDCNTDFVSLRVDAFQDGPPIGKPVAVRLRCEDYALAKTLADELVSTLRTLPGVHGVADNLEEGPIEVEIEPRSERMPLAGAAFQQVALTAHAAADGAIAGSFKDPDSDDDITIRVRGRQRHTGTTPLQRIRCADIRLDNGALVPLADVAKISMKRNYLSRYHYDARRNVVVTADVDRSITTSEAVNKLLERRFASIGQTHPGVTVTFGGEYQETQRSFSSLGRALIIALLIIYTILASQFRSYVLPLVVISAVPLAFVGVVLGLLLLQLPFTVTTFIALIGLAGIAVNDSLVLVQFIINSNRAGMPILDAIIAGTRARFRAICLTTITTVFGLLPMALQLTGKSKIWSPFAATLSFGLIIASALTLFVVPALVLLMARWGRLGGQDQDAHTREASEAV